MIPATRIHHDNQPRRAQLAWYKPQALRRCPLTIGRQDRALRARQARSTRPAKLSPGAPASPSAHPRRKSSATQHPQPEPQPVAPPQHHQ